MLYLIGLGLGDAEDITVKGLKIIKKASRVYLEAYTSILTIGKENLEKFYEREVILADREMVESTADLILEDAKENDVAFLVVGDPLGATTHTDLLLRAKSAGIPFRIIHNASIVNAVGCSGLQLYNFGEIISLVFWTETWQPDSYFEKIVSNHKRGLHTLCLLDIKVKEQSIENLMKGRKIYEPPRYMSASQAAEQLIAIIKRKQEAGELESEALSQSSLCVGVARVGAEDQQIVATSLEDMSITDMGHPLHSLIIPGHLHPLEVDMLRLYAKNPSTFDALVKDNLQT